MRIRQIAGLSDSGRVRRRNEDAYVCAPPLFAVADGMGGAQAGEIASRLAAAALREYQAGDGLEPEARLRSLIQEANRRIYARAASDPRASGMGTTMTAALVNGDRVAIGHVGGLTGLQDPGRVDRAAHRRPLARRRSRSVWAPEPRGGRGPPAALGHHAGTRHRCGGRRRQLLRRGARRRRLPPLLGRSHHDGRRGDRCSAWSRKPRTSVRPPVSSSQRPTAAAERTTSRSSCSASRKGIQPTRTRSPTSMLPIRAAD